MRTTQYIGLTNRAKEFLKTCVEVESKSSTFGMFDEQIPLGTWECTSKYEQKWRFTEVLQMSPWSSGPMLFTHLKWELVRKDGKCESMGYCFSWSVNPALMGGQELDYVKGEMCV